MEKKHKPRSRRSPDLPSEELLRERMQESGFSTVSLKHAMEELGGDFEDGEEPYWLEGAAEAVAEELSKLVSVEDRPQYAKAKLAEVLDYCADTLGIGAEAATAASELASAQSSLWYDDGDTQELESAREALVDALNELIGVLEKYETE